MYSSYWLDMWSVQADPEREDMYSTFWLDMVSVQTDPERGSSSHGQIDAEDQVVCSNQVPEGVEVKTQAAEGEAVCSDCELPAVLVTMIQARLPAGSLMRSRALCRTWNTVAASPFLLQQRLEARAGAQDCLLFVQGSHSEGGRSRTATCVYDPEADRWHKLELPPWVQEHGQWQWPWPTWYESQSCGGGVLLSATTYMQTRGEWEIVIPILLNPVAASWICLPALPVGFDGIRDVIGVYMDSTARRFILVAFPRHKIFLQDFRSTFIFDSAIGSWSETSRELPADANFERVRSDQGVFVGRVLYCVAQGFNCCDLLAYNLEQASWSWLRASTPSGQFEILYCNLINVRDRLLCVALGYEVQELPSYECLQIWELDVERTTWTVVDAMPTQIFYDLYNTREIMYSDRFMVKTGQDSQVYMSLLDVGKVVALDLRKTPGVWRWLPSWPYKNYEDGDGCDGFIMKSLHCLDPWVDFSTIVSTSRNRSLVD